MPSTTMIRRASALAAAGLVAAMLPLVGPAAPAISAEETCETEAPDNSGFPSPATRCDDITPPDTTITAVEPAPTAVGTWIRSTSVTIKFAGVKNSATDAEPAFECQFGSLDADFQPDDWKSCTSPFTRSDLKDSGSNPYKFRVRAVDAADHAIDAKTSPCSPLPIPVPIDYCPGAESDKADLDETPAETTFRVDTEAPVGRIIGAPYDENNDEWPMVESRDLTLKLLPETDDRGEEAPIAFDCTLNGKDVPCQPGVTTLRNLSPGNKTFIAVARDAAGNRDETRNRGTGGDVIRFSVPRDITESKGWRTIREGGYFGNDVLESSKVGATVSVPGPRVRELVLIAPAGPRLGKVEVSVGGRKPYVVNLNAPEFTKFKTYVLRDQFAGLIAGKITVTVSKLEKGQVARVDAILAH